MRPAWLLLADLLVQVRGLVEAVLVVAHLGGAREQLRAHEQVDGLVLHVAARAGTRRRPRRPALPRSARPASGASCDSLPDGAIRSDSGAVTSAAALARGGLLGALRGLRGLARGLRRAARSRTRPARSPRRACRSAAPARAAPRRREDRVERAGPTHRAARGRLDLGARLPLRRRACRRRARARRPRPRPRVEGSQAGKRRLADPCARVDGSSERGPTLRLAAASEQHSDAPAATTHSVSAGRSKRSPPRAPIRDPK